MHHQALALQSKGMTEYESVNSAMQSTISRQLQRIAIPKRFLIPMRQIWELQWRLPNRFGKRAYRLLEHPKFRAGFDFLLAREVAGEQLDGLGSWWEQFQHANEDNQAAMIKELKPRSGKPRKKRRRKKNNNASATQTKS